jgi:hypothetical protein
MWWQVWWPWMLLWSATAVAVVVAVSILVTHWRAHGRRTGRLAVSFYLNTTAIMGMYQQLRYKPALQRAVREEIRRSTNADIRAAFRGVRADAGWRVDRKVFSEYIETDEPITVIGILMNVLEKTDDIVLVDLERETITPNRAMSGAAPAAGSAQTAPRGTTRLRGLDAYVLVKGVYRQGVSSGTDTVAFLAPYGDEPDDPGTGAWVRVDCDTGGLRRRVPDGPFLARCLGRVERWDGRTREMVIDPIAIFK